MDFFVKFIFSVENESTLKQLTMARRFSDYNKKNDPIHLFSAKTIEPIRCHLIRLKLKYVRTAVWCHCQRFYQFLKNSKCLASSYLYIENSASFVSSLGMECVRKRIDLLFVAFENLTISLTEIATYFLTICIDSI